MLHISVVIPAHNSAATIERAIRSVHAQTYAPRELIVVDDGSSDATARIAKNCGAQVIRHTRAQGAAAARDDGIRATTAPLVALLDADDTFTPQHLHAAALNDAPLIFSRSMELRDDGTRRFPRVYTHDELLHPLWALAWDNLIPTSAAVISRRHYEAVGGFDRSFTGASTEDFDLWLRLATRGSFACTGIVGAIRHVSGSSTSRRQEALERMLENGMRAVHSASSLVGEPWFPRIATAHIKREAARRFLVAGLVDRAREEARQAVRSNPADVGAWELWALANAPFSVVTAARALHAKIQDTRARFTAA